VRKNPRKKRNERS